GQGTGGGDGGSSRGAPGRREGPPGSDEAYQHRAVATTQPIDQEASQVNDSARRCVIAIDAGTTGVRSRAIFADGPDDLEPVSSYREFSQMYPQPGWVEHDAEEIWAVVQTTLNDVITAVGRDAVTAIGITNQRETVVAWNRRTGKPYGTAIVWQDRRTGDRCDALRDAGHLSLVRDTTGLVLDPYFSATKCEWLLANREIPVDSELALGTIDAWLIWNLTGGAV